MAYAIQKYNGSIWRTLYIGDQETTQELLDDLIMAQPKHQYRIIKAKTEQPTICYSEVFRAGDRK